MTPTDQPRRRDEIAASLRLAREEIAAACAAAGRVPSDVTLVAVTKNFPAEDAAHLAALGVSDLGENRDQEASEKARELADLGVPVRWHFVGRLQRNKARSVAEYAHLVQSVDRAALVSALDDACRRRDRRLDVLVQISLDGDPSRGGVVPAERDALVESVLAAENLSLRGVMAVAPVEWQPIKAFESLADHADQVRRLAPQATEMSAGMTGDFAEAISCGATMIRLGSKLLGARRNVGYPVR
ncbi:hypothetical protein LX16_0980 [Stackebrandtia albiflava]|uniref:Pyridoxal phosphate homeostasis protein n=1 Tax=Stackebrandtia albiflava TaxID=406432 RepID=A0A562VBP3_9ACTN|nr:YggS family pyridoxal phosphate-dependent enzyme [Stackebrandtia albiflava]TWJ15280.1 hypothetical protein LX16_0980 [Stackebrandtia albiflava]